MTTASKAPRRRAAVYRLYDAEGTLLYIGSAYNPAKRSRKHRDKDWWPLVANRTDEWHPSREAAYVAETAAIDIARPPGNKISGPGAVAVPAPKPRVAVPLFVLAEIDAYFDQLAGEPPADRFRKLTALMESLEAAVLARRKDILIADAAGLSFARVHQILTASS